VDRVVNCFYLLDWIHIFLYDPNGTTCSVCNLK